jgi:diguanylate cyclase
VVGRFGGEEFVALLPGCGRSEATSIAEAVRAAMDNEAATVHGKPVRVTTSIGVAVMHPAMDNAQELFRSADQAVYRAKDAGRNRVETA